ncbi:DUF3631 domain-containing protein [Actinoalloteichus caeruleus]|uniref:DUF3631 domain-containing protein n=1 Tax=Actinoalloteichus caeruleus DSM 43889 TaxID=1120930 RepID=A0ABT1JEY6_ACTCY|nr:DUF3631 domain-containing protein [Actinoalloteichus caeruleus]MCP2330733.1 Protein of unknown function (DUF3631) [Actinoalloteichus caeruleus DSM 43889]
MTSHAPDGAATLDAVTAYIRRFSALPSHHCAPTLALWYAHTHVAEKFYITPRLILSSAEPGSGKTRVLEVAQYLVARPEMTIIPSSAALFRMIADLPTILLDEIDAIWNPKSAGQYEDLRALINSGYKRTATIPRCVTEGGAVRVEHFRVFAPVALAGIAGHMPPTITTRAIIIHMRRRAAGEQVDSFREQTVERECRPLREALHGWARSVADRVETALPALPDGVRDRPAEIWEPLLALADAAGGHWPDTARAACRWFAVETVPEETSIGVRLLSDVREVFARRRTDRVPTTALLADLNALEEAPWGDLAGRPLDARRLARELGRYGVRPGPIRVHGAVTKGYQASGSTGLEDAWSRYLPPPAVTSVTTVTPQVSPVTEDSHVTDGAVTAERAVTPLTRDVTAVTDVTDFRGVVPSTAS